MIESRAQAQILAELSRLRRENADLSLKLAAYVAAAADPAPLLPPEWGLSAGERKALLALHSSPNLYRSTEHLFTIIAGPDCEYDPRNLVSVRICALRRKLAKHGIEIETMWNEGYRLSRKSREIIDRVLRAECL